MLIAYVPSSKILEKSQIEHCTLPFYQYAQRIKLFTPEVCINDILLTRTFLKKKTSQELLSNRQ